MKYTLIIAALFWSSSNPAIISIDPNTGIFNEVNPGTADLCVQYEQITQCVKVTIPPTA